MNANFTSTIALADTADYLMSSGQLVKGLATLIEGLGEARETMPEQSWKEVSGYLRANHPVREKLYQDPLTWRALNKPRGYAGDAVMMDYIYGVHYGREAEVQASDTGRAIFRHIQSRPTSQSVVFRRRHIANLIDGLAGRTPGASVLSVASGHLREAEISAAVNGRNVSRYVAIDADADSLREVGTHYAHLGVETMHASVLHLLRRKVKVGQFDFVYAAGLYDYLADNVAQALTARLVDAAKPGGSVLIPNYAPGVEGRGYMECFMDWNLIYRDAADMRRLVANVNPAQIESCDVYSDPWGAVIYLMVKKSPNAAKTAIV
jgi:hypothetical protein